eukprot:6207253-Pleurochrysis_carterae.AAC.4
MKTQVATQCQSSLTAAQYSRLGVRIALRRASTLNHGRDRSGCRPAPTGAVVACWVQRPIEQSGTCKSHFLAIYAP